MTLARTGMEILARIEERTSSSLCRVALIAHSYVEAATRGKIRYLANFTDLLLVTPVSYPMPFGSYELEPEQESRISMLGLPISFLSWRRTSARWFLRSFDLGFRQFRPDIIQIENELHSWIIFQALLCRRLFSPRAKIIAFLWDNLTTEEQGLKGRVFDTLASFTRKYVDFFICGNQDGRRILLEKNITSDRIAVIPQEGIDAEVFYPFSPEERQRERQRHGIDLTEFAIGYVGRFVEEKGLSELVLAAGKLAKYGHKRVVLTLVGKGDFVERIRELASEIELRLIVISDCKYHQVPAIMNSLDVLVLPSRTTRFWKEQFGRVLPEAMACGVAVVGSNSGEIPHVIGDAGVIFEERNEDRLYEHLRHLCENPEFRAELAKRGRIRAIEKYTNKKIAEATHSVYRRLVNRELDTNDVDNSSQLVGATARTAAENKM